MAKSESIGEAIFFTDGIVILPEDDPIEHEVDGACWCVPEEFEDEGVLFVMHKHSKECANVQHSKAKH